MRLRFDKAQMSTKRSKNKKVHYEQQASSLADVLTGFDVLCALDQSTHARSQSIFLTLFWYRLSHTKSKIILNSLCDDLRERNLADHYVIGH